MTGEEIHEVIIEHLKKTLGDVFIQAIGEVHGPNRIDYFLNTTEGMTFITATYTIDNNVLAFKLGPRENE